MTRGDLRWRLTVPDDGSLPARREAGATAGDGLLPTLIQWDVDAYPGVSLPPQPLALVALAGTHPRAALLRQGWHGWAPSISSRSNRPTARRACAPPSKPAGHQDPGLIRTTDTETSP